MKEGVKEITLGQFIDAMERDGLPQARGTLFRTGKGGYQIHVTSNDLKKFVGDKYSKEDVVIGSACAIGQACINLGIKQPTANSFISQIIRWNDANKYTLEEIVRRARATWHDALEYRLYGVSFDYTPYLDERYQPKELKVASAD